MKLNELKSAYAAGLIEKQKYIEGMFACHSWFFDYAKMLGNTAIESIEVRDGDVIATFRETLIRMYCRVGDQRSAPWEAINFNEFEPTETRAFLDFTKDGDVVFDIGANFGYYSLLLGHQRPRSTVHAFEPVPMTYDILRRNIDLNKMKNISIHDFGFSDATKDVDIFFYEEGLVNSSLVNLSCRESVKSIKVRMETIDEFVAREGVIPKIIKCDVEGAEFLVVKGGMNTIERYKPILFLELLRKWSAPFGYQPQEVVNTLSDIGYRCLAVDSHELRAIDEINEKTTATNFFFIAKD